MKEDNMEEKSRADLLREAGIARFGSEEAWRAKLREWSNKSNRKTPRGFAKMDKKIIKELGSKGGKESGKVRRAKKKTD